MKTVDFVGSVSEGTMVTEDLIEAFVPILQEYNPEAYARIEEELNTLSNSLEDVGYGMRYNNDAAKELASYILNEDIWDAMNDVAPEGYYFGTHPGDGSDYGFWQCEKDDI